MLATLANDNETTGRRDVSVSKAGDDTYQVSISISREKRAETSFSWTVGTVVNTLEIFYGLEESEAFAKVSSLPQNSVNYSISLGRGGDGTYDLTIRSTEDPGDQLAVTIGNIASKESYEWKFGVDSGDVLEAFNALNDDDTRATKGIRLSRASDGKYNFTTIKSEVKEYDANWPTAIGVNYAQREYRQWGKEVWDIPGLKYERGKSKTLNASRGNDGNFTFAETTRTTDPWMGEAFIIGKSTKDLRMAQFFRNQFSVPKLPAGKRGQVSVNFNEEDGTYSGMATWYQIEVRGRANQSENEFHERRIEYNIKNHIWRTGQDGIPYLWKQPVTVSILQTMDLVSAQAHVNGGLKGSSVRWTGEGYRAVKIKTDESLPVKWIEGLAPGA